MADLTPAQVLLLLGNADEQAGWLHNPSRAKQLELQAQARAMMEAED